MSLQTELKGSLKEALKARDEVRLRTIRSILTAATNELVATNRKPQDELNDTEMISVIKRLAKQRKESITQFEAAGRTELAEAEKAELAILDSYLPAQLTQAELKPIVLATKEKLGVTDKSKLGQLIGAVMKEVGEQANGADVKAVVEEIMNV